MSFIRAFPTLNYNFANSPAVESVVAIYYLLADRVLCNCKTIHIVNFYNIKSTFNCHSPMEWSICETDLIIRASFFLPEMTLLNKSSPPLYHLEVSLNSSCTLHPAGSRILDNVLFGQLTDTTMF